MKKHNGIIAGLLVSCSIMALGGCAPTTEKVMKNYDRINYADGISADDAKLIAQKSLFDAIYTGPIDLYHPVVDQSAGAQQYRNFWFVVFPHRSKEDRALQRLVVVDKRTGGVIRSVDAPLEERESFDWVFP